jgi:hypothetical protein
VPDAYLIVRPGKRVDVCRSPKEAAEKYQLGHAPALLPEDAMRIQRILLRVTDENRIEVLGVEDVAPPELPAHRPRRSW